MRSFKDLSINKKLSLLVMVAAGVATLLCCVAFVINDTRRIRQSKVRQLFALADLLGSNSTAALTFDDPDTATELLSSLRKQPTIQFACLYDPQGEVFATYGEPSGEKPLLGISGHEFTDNGHLNVTDRIEEEGEFVGTIYLHASMDDLYAQYLQDIGITVVVIIVSLAASILLSSRLLRTISLPILRLADAAQKISAGGDTSIRVRKEADDELGTLYDEFNNMLDQIQHSERELRDARQGLEIRVEQRTRELTEANCGLSREAAEREKAEKELEETHKQLVITARQAGMAEVATGVLHNVGNVLNSVNVSATMVADHLRSSKISGLRGAVDMIHRHRDDLEHFFTRDEKGKLLPSFLAMLTDRLDEERDVMLGELALLVKNINHIKTIVGMQQSYAVAGGMEEAVSLPELIGDALRLNAASFEKYDIEIVRDSTEMPMVRLDKQKLLQILVNLLTNAKDAVVEGRESGRRIEICITEPLEGRVRIEVADNGVGIPEEDLTRVFSHGFTTKPHGHGFGLHTSANAAREMQGQLSAASDGPDRGAAFAVDVPFAPADLPATGTVTEKPTMDPK